MHANLELNQITALLSPLRPFWRYHDLVFSLIMTFIAWIVEMILLLRLLAVYPYSSTSKRIWFTIFIPLILLKLARIINTSIFNADYNRQLRLHSYYSPLASSQTVWRTYPNSKIEWILQVIDNRYALYFSYISVIYSRKQCNVHIIHHAPSGSAQCS